MEQKPFPTFAIGKIQGRGVEEEVEVEVKVKWLDCLFCLCIVAAPKIKNQRFESALLHERCDFSHCIGIDLRSDARGGDRVQSAVQLWRLHRLVLLRTAVAVLNRTVIAGGKELYNSCAGSLQQPHAIDRAFYLAVLQVRGLHFCWGQQVLLSQRRAI